MQISIFHHFIAESHSSVNIYHIYLFSFLCVFATVTHHVFRLAPNTQSSFLSLHLSPNHSVQLPSFLYLFISAIHRLSPFFAYREPCCSVHAMWRSQHGQANFISFGHHIRSNTFTSYGSSVLKFGGTFVTFPQRLY